MQCGSCKALSNLGAKQCLLCDAPIDRKAIAAAIKLTCSAVSAEELLHAVEAAEDTLGPVHAAMLNCRSRCASLCAGARHLHAHIRCKENVGHALSVTLNDLLNGQR